MRLTLRTLLAWLDDTLSPAEVREMGQQVTESQYAQDLVERIQRVTRQRRLTVPESGGPEGADPNIIAAYLDGELAADQVYEYERRCLASDIHLAEVASVHQILSLIGQKAKVPGPAKWRMYRLIRGPEVGPRPSIREMPAEDESPAPDWSRDDLALPSFWERNGPALAIAGLIAVLGFSAWRVIGPTSAGSGRKVEEIAGHEPAKQAAPAAPVAAPSAPVEVVNRPPIEAPTDVMPAEPESAAEAEPKPRPEPPANAFAVVEPGGAGVLLRGKPADGDWERLEPNTAVRSGDWLANMVPFRNEVRVGGMLVEMVGGTGLRIVKNDEGSPNGFELDHGQFVIREAEGPLDIAVTTQEALPNSPDFAVLKPIRIQANQLPVAVAKLQRPTTESTVVLRVMGTGGKLLVTSGDAETSYDAPTAVDVVYPLPASLPPGSWPTVVPKLAELIDLPLPEWLTEPAPEPVELQMAEDFARELTRPGRGIAESLAEVANSSTQLDLRALALAGLGETGDLDSVVSALTSSGKRTDRKAAIRVLRDLLGRGPGAAGRIERKLRDVGDKNAEWPTLVMLLLQRNRPANADWDRRINDLVGLLSSDDVELRELAIDNLMDLVGRDEMGYDPDSPSTGKGLADWQSAAKARTLKPVSP